MEREKKNLASHQWQGQAKETECPVEVCWSLVYDTSGHKNSSGQEVSQGELHQKMHLHTEKQIFKKH